MSELKGKDAVNMKPKFKIDDIVTCNLGESETTGKIQSFTFNHPKCVLPASGDISWGDPYFSYNIGLMQGDVSEHYLRLYDEQK